MNRSEDIVDHIDERGVVTGIDRSRGELKVRIEPNMDCGSCPASKLCGAASGKGTEVTVAVGNVSGYRTGDRVVVRGTERMHRKAIMLATVLPCIALIAVMVAVYLLTGNQLTAALSGMGSMVVFFLALYLCRNRIAHEFVFELVERKAS